MSAGRSWIWAAVAAVVAVLVTVGVVQLLSGDDSQPAGSSSTPTPTVTPSPTPTPDETPAPTEEPLTLVAAYFLGETPRHPPVP
ncbi:MAG: hypothetical protein HZY75_07200 [Nocardioidaceae bacterium]|nr:MAG: hypothetical protein HZY75_07200 [Nocardioidaceae bacterium]